MRRILFISCRRRPRPTDANATLLAAIQELKDEVMAGIDDLKTAVAGLETKLAKNQTYLQGLPAIIKQEIANASGNSAAMEANLTALANQINADAAGLSGDDDAAAAAIGDGSTAGASTEPAAATTTADDGAAADGASTEPAAATTVADDGAAV